MIVRDVMKDIGDRVRFFMPDLNVFGFPADSISPPAAILAYPEEITYDETYDRGMDRMTLPLLLVVGKANDEAARDNLVPYADGAGAKSIKATIETGSYSAFDTVRVMNCVFEPVTLAGVEYAGAFFDLDIAGSGS